MTMTNVPNKTAPKKLPDDEFAEVFVDLNKGPSTTPIKVPDALDFGSGEYMEGGMLGLVVTRLIDQNETDLGHLKGLDLTAFWKKQGGKTHGKNRLADVVKPTGLLYYTLEADFVLWLAADHCQKMTRAELERLVFRHLLRMARDKDGACTIRDYDFHLFAAEVRKYGVKAEGAQSLVNSLRQLGFDDVAEAEQAPAS